MKLSLLAQAVDDAFALPGSYGTLAVTRRAWNEYKAALAAQDFRCECQPPYHRAGCIWSAPKEQVTACLDSSLCECGRKHARPWCVTHDAPLLCSSGGHNCVQPPALPSRENLMQIIGAEIGKAEMVGNAHDAVPWIADAVLALIEGKL